MICTHHTDPGNRAAVIRSSEALGLLHVHVVPCTGLAPHVQVNLHTHICAREHESPISRHSHTLHAQRIHSFGNAWIAPSPQAAKNGWKCITTRWHSAPIPSVAVSSSFSSAAVYVCVYVCCCVAKCVKRWRVNLTEFPTQSSPTDKKYRSFLRDQTRTL